MVRVVPGAPSFVVGYVCCVCCRRGGSEDPEPADSQRFHELADPSRTLSQDDFRPAARELIREDAVRTADDLAPKGGGARATVRNG